MSKEELKTNFQHVQRLIDELISELGGYWNPLSMLAACTEELGELAREINALEGYKPKKKILGKISETDDIIGEEICDLLFSIFCIANYYRIDINANFSKILSKYRKRDKNRFNHKPQS